MTFNDDVAITGALDAQGNISSSSGPVTVSDTFTVSPTAANHYASLKVDSCNVSATKRGIEGAVTTTMKTSFADGSTVGTSDASENTLVSFTFPANSLDVAGKVIRPEGFGKFSTGSAQTIVIRWKIGSTTVATSRAIALENGVTDGAWHCQGVLNIQDASTPSAATYRAFLSVDFQQSAGKTDSDLVRTSGTLDLTTANTGSFTAQFGAANASNAITAECFIGQLCN